jgi:hypothetical protein
METKVNTDITSSYNSGKQFFLDRIKAGNIPKCSVGFVSGSCKSGHKYAAVQFCGKEYCEDCGKDGSPIHQRRVNKWFNYIKNWTSVGYLVVTIPEQYRPFFYNKDVLKDFRFKLLRLLKEKYRINKGLARYHFYGDCKACNGRGCIYCKSTGAGADYYPHLNILLEAGYISNLAEWLNPIKKWMKLYFKKLVKEELAKIRRYIANGDKLENKLNELLDCLSQLNNPKYDLIIDYSYVEDDAMKMNRVKYITRSTFRHFHKKTVKVLYNFRNSVVWGWKKEAKEEVEEQPLFCPVCAKQGRQHLIYWHTLQKFEANQYIITYDKSKRKRPLHRITDRNNPADRRNRRAIPIVFKKTSGKISRNFSYNDSGQNTTI